MHFIQSRLKPSTCVVGLILFQLTPSVCRADGHEAPPEMLRLAAEELYTPLDPAKLRQMLLDAESAERRLNWIQAVEIYEGILRADRNLSDVRGRYLHAVRRIWQVRRHRDESFRTAGLSLDLGQSMRLCGSVIDKLTGKSLDGKDKSFALLLEKGVEELSHALADPNFVLQYVPSSTQHKVSDFRNSLSNLASGKPKTRLQLNKQIRDITMAAQDKLGLPYGVIVLELAAGCCYAFDEYTSYLTPNQMSEIEVLKAGGLAGIGIISLTSQNGKIVIGDVIPNSPAGELMPPLKWGDQVVSINKKTIGIATPEGIMEQFEGPAGTTIELEVLSPTVGSRFVTLCRRVLSSITYHMRTDLIGYLHISSFQETTLQDLDEAILNLTKNNMKGAGSSICAATAAACLTLPWKCPAASCRRGLSCRRETRAVLPFCIHAIRRRSACRSWSWSTATRPAALKPWPAPSRTTNEPDWLARRRSAKAACRKSSPCRKVPGALPPADFRITVAHFFSPEGVHYSRGGVVPHILVERMMPDGSLMDTHQIEEAVLEAQRLIGS